MVESIRIIKIGPTRWHAATGTATGGVQRKVKRQRSTDERVEIHR